MVTTTGASISPLSLWWWQAVSQFPRAESLHVRTLENVGRLVAAGAQTKQKHDCTNHARVVAQLMCWSFQYIGCGMLLGRLVFSC
jgi:hypothetical protein